MKHIKKITTGIAVVILSLIGLQTHAAKRYWIGNGSNKNWNSTGNWSLTSGGASGASLPSSTDSVYFDNNGTGQCSINATVNVMLFTIAAGYTDTIRQNARLITATEMMLTGGTFMGGTVDMNVTGSFTLAGTYFISTSAILTVRRNYTFTSGSFLHNNGTLLLNGLASSSITGNTVFYNLTFASTNTYTLADSTILTVEQTLRLGSAGGLLSGRIYAKGNIVNASLSAYNGAHTTVIEINGAGNQTIVGHPSAYPVHGWMPDMKVNKTSGTLYLSGYVTIRKTWEVVQGTVDATTNASTICFPVGATGGMIGGIIKGIKNQRFYNVQLSTYGGYTHTFTVNDSIEIAGTLTLHGNGSIKLEGYIHAEGNLSLLSAGTAGGGEGTINIDGNGTQVITGNNLANTSELCNVVITKSPTDSLILKNTISVGRSWNHVSGIVDALTYGSTVAFCDGTRTIHQPYPFHHVAFVAAGAATNTIATGDTITVKGNLIFSGSSSLFLNGGAVNAEGDVSTLNTHASSRGTGWIHICGSGAQTLKGQTEANKFLGGFCSIHINKPSGILTLVDNISMTYPGADYYWKYTRGTVDEGTSRVIINGNYGYVNSTNGSASMWFNKLMIRSGFPNLSGAINVGGELHIASSGRLTTNNYAINLKGNFNNQGQFYAGTGTVWFTGNTNQTISVTGTGSFHELKIEKPGGKVYLANQITVEELTLVRGVLAGAGSNCLRLADNGIATGGSDSSYVHGPILKVGDDAFTFPLGDTILPDTSAYHPFAMTAPAGTSSSFTVQYHAKDPLTDHSSFTAIQSSLKNVSTCEYWSVTRNAGSAVVLPTLSWNANSCNISIPAELRVAGWDGSQWKNMGQASLTGDSLKGTITAAGPGINLGTQYYTTGNVPHALLINTEGLDSLVMPDTLKYTVSGAGLSGTYIAGGSQNVYPDLPSTGSVTPITLTIQAGNQNLQIGIELTPSGTVKNPHVIVVPPGPSEPVCSVVHGCFEAGSIIKINECLLKNCFKLATTSYAVLRRQLDGGYFPMINGDFRFRFDEEYLDTDGKLSLRLYNDQHKLLLDMNTLTTASLKYNSNYGTRYYSVNLKSCYDHQPFYAGYYTVEIENEKKEVWKARLKNIAQGEQPACPSIPIGD